LAARVAAKARQACLSPSDMKIKFDGVPVGQRLATGLESMRPVAAIPQDQRRQSSLRTQNSRRALRTAQSGSR
jgi:hypothetical protein